MRDSGWGQVRDSHSGAEVLAWQMAPEMAPEQSAARGYWRDGDFRAILAPCLSHPRSSLHQRHAQRAHPHAVAHVLVQTLDPPAPGIVPAFASWRNGGRSPCSPHTRSIASAAEKFAGVACCGLHGPRKGESGPCLRYFRTCSELHATHGDTAERMANARHATAHGRRRPGSFSVHRLLGAGA